MADIRIKDLATLESASLTGDVFVIDGTTGTRKLSAFSPSFGGNATVTGTLTVNGTGTTTIGGTGAVGSPRLFLSGDAGLQIKNATSSRYRVDFYANNVIAKGVLDAYDDTGSAYIPLLISGSRLEVDNTTASTTTSSGALVVSGGLGLAGNLNMGGSLSVAGGSGISLDTTGSASLRFNDGASTKWWIYKLNGDINLYYRDMVNSRMQMVMVPGADSQTATTALYSKFSVDATTASTSTSSGALVVGNGTSGGLGVGGAASIGGPILVGTSSDVYLSRVGAGILDIRSASSPGTTARLDVTGTTSAGVGFRQSGSRDWFISAESSELRVFCTTAASIFAFNSGTPVAMRDTTASTTTSSGALVVSGGVGVAGKVNAGSFTTTGHTTSAVENVNVSTTAVDIAIATSVGAIYFVSGYNNSGGAQGTWLLMVRGSNVTTVSSDNNTGLTVTFSVSSGKLQAATASGTLVTNAYAITR